jgi:hypothetical protein
MEKNFLKYIYKEQKCNLRLFWKSRPKAPLFRFRESGFKLKPPFSKGGYKKWIYILNDQNIKLVDLQYRET